MALPVDRSTASRDKPLVPDPTLPLVSPREGYDQWAPHYDAYDNAVIAIEGSVVRGLLGIVQGLRVADVGCGTGRHALRMASEGAEVTGVDFSAGMLAVLRTKLNDELRARVTLVEHDITTGLSLPSDSHDLALCSLVLEHLPDLDGAFSELARICRPGGRVIVAEFHPEMFRRGLHARFRAGDGAQKVQIEGADHTISDYVMAAVRAGLTIVSMREYQMDAQTAAGSRSAAKYLGEPMLLCLELRA